jgi:hypothetical protein
MTLASTLRNRRWLRPVDATVDAGARYEERRHEGGEEEALSLH